jgi:hypothetical protein
MKAERLFVVYMYMLHPKNKGQSRIIKVANTLYIYAVQAGRNML